MRLRAGESWFSCISFRIVVRKADIRSHSLGSILSREMIILWLQNDPSAAFVRAFAFDDTGCLEICKLLFDGLGCYPDCFGKLSS